MRLLLLAALLLPAAAEAQDRPTVSLARLDEHLEADWKKKGLKPGAPCDDATFLRRLTLDLTGNIPRPDDVRDFLKSTRKDKRAARIEELLAAPEASEYFAHLWIEWLMNYDVGFRDIGRISFSALAGWLREIWDKDLPYDRMVHAILTARGDTRLSPAAAFFAKHLAPQDPPAALAGFTARLFLGRDIRCAQCHDHPFEPVTQEEFWGYAAFFRPLTFANRAVSERPPRRPSTLRDDMGEHFAEPRFMDGRGPESGESSGEALARLLLSFEKDAAARALVARVWKLYFGRSIAPSRNDKGRPDILEVLTRGFIANRQSLRWLVKSIVTSRAYLMAGEGTDAARREYAAGPLKMMNPVQYSRAFNFALQLEKHYLKAMETQPRVMPYNDPDTLWVGLAIQAKDMIFPKGRDPEEFMATGSDRLALRLMNNRDIQALMFHQDGLIRKRVMARLSLPEQRVEELFLLLMGRPPSRSEKSNFVDFVKRMENPYHAYEDLFWMLFNSSEFIFVG